MALTVRKGKVNRHEKITIVLLSGKPVSPQEIAECFKGKEVGVVAEAWQSDNGDIKSCWSLVVGQVFCCQSLVVCLESSKFIFRIYTSALGVLLPDD